MKFPLKRFVNKKIPTRLCFRRFSLSQTFVYFSDFTNYWLIRKLAFFNKYVRLQENCHYVQQLLLWCRPSNPPFFRTYTEQWRTFDLWQETRNIVTKRQLILIICHNCVHPRVNKNGGKTYPKSTVSLTPHKHFSYFRRLQSLAESWWVLLSLAESCWVLLRIAESCWVLRSLILYLETQQTVSQCLWLSVHCAKYPSVARFL